ATELHQRLAEIELELGRRREQHWGPRMIDLDLLLYDDLVLDTPTLTVPHPRMAFRRFVLEPAADVAPDMSHPTIGWSIRELLDHLNLAKPYVALMGVPGSGKTLLAERLSQVACAYLLTRPNPLGAGRGGSYGPTYDRQIEFVRWYAQHLGTSHW